MALSRLSHAAGPFQEYGKTMNLFIGPVVIFPHRHPDRHADRRAAAVEPCDWEIHRPGMILNSSKENLRLSSSKFLLSKTIFP
jgi:hypothetical protein